MIPHKNKRSGMIVIIAVILVLLTIETNGLRLRERTAMVPKKLEEMIPPAIKGPPSVVLAKKSKAEEQTDLVKLYTLKKGSIGMGIVQVKVNDGAKCEDLWDASSKFYTDEVSKEQEFCLRNKKVNDEEKSDDTILDDTILGSDKLSSGDYYNTGEAAEKCCRDPKTCKDAWILYPNICNDRQKGDKKDESINLGKLPTIFSFNLQDHVSSKCCTEAEKTCEEFEVNWKAKVKASRERKERDIERLTKQKIQTPTETLLGELGYCEMYSRTYNEKNTGEKMSLDDRLEKCCVRVEKQSCEDFKNNDLFCPANGKVKNEENVKNTVSSDTRLNVCCKSEEILPSWTKMMGSYVSKDNSKSVSSFMDAVKTYLQYSTSVKSKKVRWNYGNLQEPTCLSTVSNTNEVAHIQHDALRYLNDFNNMMTNFERYMNAKKRKLLDKDEDGEGLIAVKFHPADVKSISRMREKSFGKYSVVSKHSCRDITDACRGSLYFEDIFGVIDFIEELSNEVRKQEKERFQNSEECDPTQSLCLPPAFKRIEFTGLKNRMRRNSVVPEPTTTIESATTTQSIYDHQINTDLLPYDTLYRDIMINVKMYMSEYDFHIAEMQVHLRNMAKAKREGGHTFYRVIRQQTESVQQDDSKFGGARSFWSKAPSVWWEMEPLRFVPEDCGKDGSKGCVDVEDYIPSMNPPAVDVSERTMKPKPSPFPIFESTCDLPEDIGGGILNIPEKWNKYLEIPELVERWKGESQKECEEHQTELKTEQAHAREVWAERRDRDQYKVSVIGERDNEDEVSCDTADKGPWDSRAQVQMAIDKSKCLYVRDFCVCVCLCVCVLFSQFAPSFSFPHTDTLKHGMMPWKPPKPS